jgi:uncharacterized protein YkwD
MHFAARTFVALLSVVLILQVHTPGADARACHGASARPTLANIAQVEHATLCLINVQRRMHGLAPLRSNGLLRLAALRHSRDMVTNGYFEHQGRDGSSFVARIRQTGYFTHVRFWKAGENIAWGVGSQAPPRAIVRAWMNSPPHRRNILTAGFRGIGVGVTVGSPRYRGRGATYTTDFGYRVR